MKNTLSVILRNAMNHFVSLRAFVWMFLIAVSVPVLAFAGMPDTVLLDRSARLDLAGHFERYDDLSGKKTLAEILDPGVSVRFIPLHDNLNDGYSRKSVWLRFCLLRTSQFPSTAVLRCWSPGLDDVTVYIQEGNDPADATAYHMIRVGDHIPVADRPELDPDFLIPFSLPEGKPVTVYIRLQSTGPLKFSASVHTPSDTKSFSKINILFKGGYLAVVATIALLSFIFFLRVRDRIVLFFLLYICAVFITDFSANGIINLIMPRYAHLLSDYLVEFGKGGVIFFFSMFCLQFFAAEQSIFTKIYLVFLSANGILTMIAAPLGITVEISPFVSMSALVGYFLILWLCYQAFRNSQSGGAFFPVAFALSTLGYVLYFLKLMALVPFDWLHIHNNQLVSLVNIFIMTIGMSQRFLDIRRQAQASARHAELKEMELEAERVAAERHKRFIAMISHEYRTPLAIIRSSIDLMEMEQNGKGDQSATKLEAMKRAVDRLVDVMDVSLEKSRLSDAQERADSKSIPIGQFIASELDELRALFPMRNFHTVSHFDDGAFVVIEPRYLKTVLFNLLDNARKYAADESPIEVEYVVEGGEAVLRIRNRSAVSLEEDTAGLFDKYRRGNNSSDTGGAGLGLWLVREIVSRFGGSIGLEHSENMVTATLRLPLAENIHQHGL